jgi:hypothetical protein
LLAPELESGLIGDVLEGLDILGGEAAAEDACGGGIGDAIGPQGAKEDEVIASQLDVAKAGAVADGVVGEIQDVVTLVVGEVVIEQVKPLIDGLGEAEFAGQKVDGANAPAATPRVLVAAS